MSNEWSWNPCWRFLPSFMLGREVVRQIMRWDMAVLLSPDTTAQVEALSIDRLEALVEALLDFTQASDLMDWLGQNA
jgi:hypothetical protein